MHPIGIVAGFGRPGRPRPTTPPGRSRSPWPGCRNVPDPASFCALLTLSWRADVMVVPPWQFNVTDWHTARHQPYG